MLGQNFWSQHWNENRPLGGLSTLQNVDTESEILNFNLCDNHKCYHAFTQYINRKSLDVQYKVFDCVVYVQV